MAQLIGRVNLAADAASFTLSSISQAFRTLELILDEVRVSDAAQVQDIWLRLNADSGNNYDKCQVRVTGTTGVFEETIGAAQLVVCSAAGASAASGFYSAARIHIYRYTNATHGKNLDVTALEHHANTAGNQSLRKMEAYYRGTAAITSLTLLDSGAGNLLAGMTASLYGYD